MKMEIYLFLMKQNMKYDDGEMVKKEKEQLSCPDGLIVNEVGDIYVADNQNNRVMCWPVGSKEGYIVLGGDGSYFDREKSNNFKLLKSISFDVDTSQKEMSISTFITNDC